MKKLLIVESPAKAKTIGKYLGADFTVKSSVGHIRDLPKTNGAITIEPVSDGEWTFTPTYEISEGKDSVVKELKSATKEADEIYLASDPDREGEAIAWHLREVLAPVAKGKPFHRVTYNEITKPAVLKAVAEPRDIDMPRVDAQQARRILDRLVGYRVSPILWKNIQCPNNRTLSAGRVQSVALRLLVERQREIEAFKPETYYLVGAEIRKQGAPKSDSFATRLARFDGAKPDIREKSLADNILLELQGATLRVTDLKAQPKVRHPLPPFTTSTLQQAASSVLGFSPGKTMKSAQKLYESGAITYMRTDSVNISDLASAAAKDFITQHFGPSYYPSKPNFYKSKADAQGAHEAIRPTHIENTPMETAFDPVDQKLYDLIWRRFMASQMADAQTTLHTASFEPVKPGVVHSYLFTASATAIDFDGFLKVMKLSLKKSVKKAEKEEERGEDSDEVDELPPMSVGEILDVTRWLADEKQTKGPSHYSEASLIKALEENGVGRPSTYAQTIETLKTRGYAEIQKKKLVPLERGILVCDYLVKNLDDLFNVHYTAEMEGELDKVEEQGEPMNEMLSAFYRKFLTDLKESADRQPTPDRSKFDLVFRLLENVKEWKKPVKVGKRTYDDHKYFESVRSQGEAGKPLSDRQLQPLVRMVLNYAAQIPGAEQSLKDAGLAGNVATRAEKADPEAVAYAFSVMSRIPAMGDNHFMRSLREQVDGGRALSIKQFNILARSVGENCGQLPDAAEIRARLAPFAPGGFPDHETNPEIPRLVEFAKKITVWREPTTRGKHVYDDKEFVLSLVDQYGRRGMLSDRQVSALKRVLKIYKDQIPGYDDAESSGR